MNELRHPFPDVDRWLQQIAALENAESDFRAALMRIACYIDEGANHQLRLTASYSGFDEPVSVQIAREVLEKHPHAKES